MLLIDWVADGHLMRHCLPNLILPLRRPRSVAHHWLNRWLVMHRCVEKWVILWQVFAQDYLLLVADNFAVIFWICLGEQVIVVTKVSWLVVVALKDTWLHRLIRYHVDKFTLTLVPSKALHFLRPSWHSTYFPFDVLSHCRTLLMATSLHQELLLLLTSAIGAVVLARPGSLLHLFELVVLPLGVHFGPHVLWEHWLPRDVQFGRSWALVRNYLLYFR